MKRLLALLLVVAGSVPAAFVGASGDTAPKPEDFEGPDVLWYGQPPLRSADGSGATDEEQLTVVQGERTDRGCRVTVEGEVTGAETWIQRAYDASNCRYLFEVRPSADDIEAPEGALTGSMSLGTNEPPLGLASAASVTHEGAWSISQFDEPARWAFGAEVNKAGPIAVAGLDKPVTFAKNNVEWHPDGTCANSPGWVGQVKFGLYWLETTGWRNTSHVWNRTTDAVCRSIMWSGSEAVFRNSVFCLVLLGIGESPPLCGGATCPDTSTLNTFEPNEIVGRKDGTAYKRWIYYNEGGCRDLLRFAGLTKRYTP